MFRISRMTHCLHFRDKLECLEIRYNGVPVPAACSTPAGEEELKRLVAPLPIGRALMTPNTIRLRNPMFSAIHPLKGTLMMPRALLALTSALLLTSCATTDVQSALNSVKDMGRSLSNGNLRSAALTEDSATDLTATRLRGVLRQNLATDGQAPEWPKVVITDLQIPADQLDFTRGMSLKPNECIRFNAVLWQDASDSERLDDLRLCAEDLPRQSNGFVVTWYSFPISGKTTGQVRADGPTPPYNKLPSGTTVDTWIMNRFGQYYIGSLLTLVGYEPNFTIDDRRFWIKNVK